LNIGRSQIYLHAIQTKTPPRGRCFCLYGAPGAIRTPDRLVRSQYFNDLSVIDRC